MDYPLHLLPQEGYKCIESDLSEYYLVRHIPSRYRDSFWDEETDTINIRCVCSPTENIYDLSTSLFGVFAYRDNFIELTKEGRDKYSQYCDCDTIVNPPPVYPDDFQTDNGRAVFYMKIGDIAQLQAEYQNQKTDESFKANAKVSHTPMLWNFWHFSVKWLPEETREITKGMKKKIATEARATIAQFCQRAIGEYPVLPESEYQKEIE